MLHERQERKTKFSHTLTSETLFRLVSLDEKGFPSFGLGFTQETAFRHTRISGKLFRLATLDEKVFPSLG